MGGATRIGRGFDIAVRVIHAPRKIGAAGPALEGKFHAARVGIAKAGLERVGPKARVARLVRVDRIADPPVVFDVAVIPGHVDEVVAVKPVLNAHLVGRGLHGLGIHIHHKGQGRVGKHAEIVVEVGKCGRGIELAPRIVHRGIFGNRVGNAQARLEKPLQIHGFAAELLAHLLPVGQGGFFRRVEEIREIGHAHVKRVEAHAAVDDDAFVLDAVLHINGVFLWMHRVFGGLKREQIVVDHLDLRALLELRHGVIAIQNAGFDLMVVIHLTGEVALDLKRIAIQILVVKAGLPRAEAVVAKCQVEVFLIARIRREKGSTAIGEHGRTIDAQVLVGLGRRGEHDEVAIFTHFDKPVVVVVGIAKLAGAVELGHLHLVERARRKRVRPTQIAHRAELFVARVPRQVKNVARRKISVRPPAQFAAVIHHQTAGELARFAGPEGQLEGVADRQVVFIGHVRPRLVVARREIKPAHAPHGAAE